MSSENRPENLSASDALSRLQHGNLRYIQDKGVRPNSDSNRREQLTGGQKPYAIILACADSRVSPEIVFDEGLGDLFVIRVAGNVSDNMVLGSIEYAVLHLGVNLVVVMGHQSCGAVTAAMDNKDFDGPATHSHIDSLIDAIRPAVRAVADGDNLLERSIKQNAVMVSAQIRTSDPVMGGLEKDGVVVAPAYYKLDSGEVVWI